MSYRLIKASEISDYLYCRRSWWLRRMFEIKPGNIQELAAGARHHRQHGKIIAQGTWSHQIALLLIFIAVAVLFYWLVQSL